MINLYDWYFELERFFEERGLTITSIAVSVSSNWRFDGSKSTVDIEGTLSLRGDSEFLHELLTNQEVLLTDDAGCDWIITGGSITEYNDRDREYEFSFKQLASRWEWCEL